MTDSQAQEIGRLIQEGNTSGRLDDEQADGSYEFVAWELKTNSWVE